MLTNQRSISGLVRNREFDDDEFEGTGHDGVRPPFTRPPRLPRPRFTRAETAEASIVAGPFVQCTVSRARGAPCRLAATAQGRALPAGPPVEWAGRSGNATRFARSAPRPGRLRHHPSVSAWHGHRILSRNGAPSLTQMPDAMLADACLDFLAYGRYFYLRSK
jgi:hypothetical protein